MTSRSWPRFKCVPTARAERPAGAPAAVAQALDLDPHAAGTGHGVVSYCGHEGACVEIDAPGIKEGTNAVTSTEEGAILALQEALQVADDARLICPNPLEPALLVDLPPHRYASNSPVEHVYAWGHRRAFDEWDAAGSCPYSRSTLGRCGA